VLNETKPREKAHPSIAPLFKPHKTSPLEYHVKVLEAGVRVLCHVEHHLLWTDGFNKLDPVEQVSITDALMACRVRRSILAAELQRLEY
jgi:hypothetical protein